MEDESGNLYVNLRKWRGSGLLGIPHSSRLIHESSRSYLERGWSSDGVLWCQLNVGFKTDDTLRVGGR